MNQLGSMLGIVLRNERDEPLARIVSAFRRELHRNTHLAVADDVEAAEGVGEPALSLVATEEAGEVVVEGWQKLMRNGMARDHSWDRSAREYAALYREAMAKV